MCLLLQKISSVPISIGLSDFERKSVLVLAQCFAQPLCTWQWLQNYKNRGNVMLESILLGKFGECYICRSASCVRHNIMRINRTRYLLYINCYLLTSKDVKLFTTISCLDVSEQRMTIDYSMISRIPLLFSRICKYTKLHDMVNGDSVSVTAVSFLICKDHCAV